MTMVPISDNRIGLERVLTCGLALGALLALGFRAQDIFVAAAIPAFGVTLLMTMFGR